MRVLVLASDLGIENSLRRAAEEGGFKSEGAPLPQSICSSALFRDPDTIGVIWSSTLEFARMTVQGYRQADITNLLFVLLHCEEATDVNRACILVAGADDVQPAPIDRREFIARLDALARRAQAPKETSPVALPNGARYFPDRGVLEYPAGSTILSRKEAALMSLLTSRPGVVATRQMCMDALYGGMDEPRAIIINIFICRIRKKLILATQGLDVLETIWGRGWMFISAGFVPIFTDARTRTRAAG